MSDVDNGANKAKADIFAALREIHGDGHMLDFQDLIESIDALIKARTTTSAEG